MTAEELLGKVKKSLGITGTYQDDTLSEYIDETKAFLIDAGVKEEDITPGIVTRGVSDLWNYGSGNADFSQYFMKRAIQLAYNATPDTYDSMEISEECIKDACGGGEN